MIDNLFIIAEAGVNHNGSLSVAKEMVRVAKECGADAIKFQIFTAIERATENHPEWEIFEQFSLSHNEWETAVTYARKKRILVYADIFGDESFEIANAIGVDGFKIHSEDLLNTFFIEKID